MRKIRFKRYRLIKPSSVDFARLIPSIITLIGMGIGLSAIRFALSAKWEMAVLCILAAAVIDGIDGRIARLLNASTLFGAELDSLCDFANFGIAPGLVLYLWSLQDLKFKLIGWSVVLFFAMAMVIRLARFNVTSKNPKYGDFYKKFFLGIPAPCGGILILMPLIISFDLAEDFNYSVREMHGLISTYVVILGTLVASRIPTFSLKSFLVSQEYVWVVLLLFAITIAITIMYPWYTLPILGFVYILSIPISFIYAKVKLLNNKEENTNNKITE